MYSPGPVDTLDATQQKTRQSAIISAFVLGTAAAGGFTLLPVTLPALATAFDLSPGMVGLVSTLELVGVTSGALAAGLFSRRFPTRPLAIIVTTVLLICALATMFVSGIAVLAGIRFVDGIMAGVALSLAYSVLSTTKRPDRNFAILAVFPLIYGAVGFALIPAFENTVGWHASFVVLSVTDAIALVASFWLTASLRAGGSRLSFVESLPNLRGTLALTSVVLYYAGACAIYAYAFTIGIQMTGSEDVSGNTLSISQLVGIAGCALAAFIAGRFPRRPAIIFGFSVTIAGILFLLSGGGTSSYIIGFFAINFAWNFLAGSHIAAVGTMDKRGSAAAFLAVAINGGAALGPLLGFTIVGDSYAALEWAAILLTAVALAFILIALRGKRELATGRPVLEEEVLEEV